MNKPRQIRNAERAPSREQEQEWKNAEGDALYRPVAAEVRVSKPFGYFNDVLIMALVGMPRAIRRRDWRSIFPLKPLASTTPC